MKNKTEILYHQIGTVLEKNVDQLAYKSFLSVVFKLKIKLVCDSRRVKNKKNAILSHLDLN